MDKKNKSAKIDLIFADDLMTENVATVDRKTGIGQVAHRMLRDRVSGYPVLDENENLVGLVTLTDLFVLLDKMVKESAVSHGENQISLQDKIAQVKNVPIHEIMTTQIVTIAPETPLSEIIHSVVGSNIHTFPVVQEGKLVGIIGRHDILNATFVYG